MLDRDLRVRAVRYGPPVLLLVVVAFMFWVRMVPADRVITDAQVYYAGNDAWYHKRVTHYAVRYFPQTTAFDPWSNFPYGTGRHSGFGGLYDQLVAAAALVVGLGSPSDRTVNVVLAVAPAAFGALTAVPTYVVARRLTDRWGGALAAVLLSLASGTVLFRTVVGAADHQSAEALFGTVAVVGFLYAVTTAYRESPTLADVRDRNWRFLRAPVLAGVTGGVAVAAYMMVWPPGVMLLFTFAVFVLVQTTRDHLAGRATDPLTIATLVSGTTAGVLTLLYARSYALEATGYSLLQPLVAFGLAAGALVLFGLSRYAEREGYDRRRYPQIVAALLVLAVAVTWIVFPRGIDLFQRLVVRIYSFGLLTSPSAGTVVEIRPATLDTALAAFAGTFVLAVGGFALLFYAVLRENRPVALFVVLWSLTMFAAYFTMARFGYYFAVTVAILAAVAVWWAVTELLAIDLVPDGTPDLDTYQVIGVLLVVLLVLPGNVVGVSGRQPVWNEADDVAITDQSWVESMEWMRSNTPEEPLAYYDQYERPADGDFEYPERAYGVMSWWDYGHWITVMGHRIPYTNPFQEGPVPASVYFQATEERRANLALEALPSLSENPGRVANMSTAELRDVVADQPASLDDENGRYVVIDDEMAGGKFRAMTAFAGPGEEAYFQPSQYTVRGQNVTLTETSARYDATQLADLYYEDARNLSHYRLVHEADRYSVVGGYATQAGVSPLTALPLQRGWDSVAPLASRLREAEQSSTAVPVGQGYVYDGSVESQVKLYEHVEGATLTGTVPGAGNGTTVSATLELETHTGRNFTYVQRTTTAANGSFEMTVPYATNDAVTVGEGGTNASVDAVGDYAIQVGGAAGGESEGTVTVPESAIYDGETIEVQVQSAS